MKAVGVDPPWLEQRSIALTSSSFHCCLLIGLALFYLELAGEDYSEPASLAKPEARALVASFRRNLGKTVR